MATPAGDSYTCASGGAIAAGRTRFPHAPLLNLISGAAENTWIQANTNTIDSVFPVSDFCPPYMAGASNPATVILAWSGFGWDSRNHRLVIWGGGHANGSGNDVFEWSAVDRNWKLAFNSSDVIFNATSGYVTVDGDLHSPISSHTYSNNAYLPKLNRFITFGGAAHSSGAGFVVRDGDSILRGLPGGYTLDMTLSGQGYVAGVTGSNVKRNTTAAINLPGANAWYARDYLLDNPSHLTYQMGHVNGQVVYAEDGGIDVLYVIAAYGGGTSPALIRIAYNDANDYATDVVTQVGQAWDNTTTDTGAALDTEHNVIVHIGSATYPFFGWDLKYAGATNHNFRVPAAGLTGPDAAAFIASDMQGMGLLYDQVRGRFVAWSRGGKVWSIEAPSGAPTPMTGWVVTVLADPSSPRPATTGELSSIGSDSGVHGKWKYAPDIDCYVGLQGSTAGNVWFFKPSGWIDPRT